MSVGCRSTSSCVLCLSSLSLCEGSRNHAPWPWAAHGPFQDAPSALPKRVPPMCLLGFEMETGKAGPTRRSNTQHNTKHHTNLNTGIGMIRRISAVSVPESQGAHCLTMHHARGTHPCLQTGMQPSSFSDGPCYGQRDALNVVVRSANIDNSLYCVPWTANFCCLCYGASFRRRPTFLRRRQ